MMVIANAFAKLQTVKNFLRPFCKKRRLGTRFHSQHVKVSQNLAKSPWEHFYNGFWSFWEKLIWKISPLVLPEILGVFLTTLTANGKYAVQDWENLPLPIQMPLSEKQNNFSEFFVPFLQSTSTWRKNMMVIAIIFPKLETVKNFVRPFCQKRRFGTRSYSQDVKVCQVLARSPWERFYYVFSSFWVKLIWKMFPLVLGEILGVFVNTVTVDGKYPVQVWENFLLPIQMQLSEKRKTRSQFFFSVSGIYIKF